jgi:hypothetical protein
MKGVCAGRTLQRPNRGTRADEPACKPGSVTPDCSGAGDHPSRAAVADSLQRSTRELGRAALERSLSDLAPGGVYRAARVTSDAGGLLHHRFTLTGTDHRGDRAGGLFSVALSRGSPRVGVAHHLALWSPDFPRRGPGTNPGPSTRPPGRLVRRAHKNTLRPARSAPVAWPRPPPRGAPARARRGPARRHTPHERPGRAAARCRPPSRGRRRRPPRTPLPPTG